MPAVWTNPRSWVTNEIVDAAEMNQHVRDNLLYLYQTAGSAHGTRLYKSGSPPTFTSGSANVLTWNNSITVTDSMWSSGTRFVTVPSAYPGLWDISGAVTWDGNANGYRQASLLKNGSIVAFSQQNGNAAGNTHNFAFIGILAAATDYFEIQVKQTSGVSLSLATAVSYDTWVSGFFRGF